MGDKSMCDLCKQYQEPLILRKCEACYMRTSVGVKCNHCGALPPCQVTGCIPSKGKSPLKCTICNKPLVPWDLELAKQAAKQLKTSATLSESKRMKVENKLRNAGFEHLIPARKVRRRRRLVVMERLLEEIRRAQQN